MMEVSCALVMLGAYLLAGNEPVAVAGETLMPFDFDAIREHAAALGRFRPARPLRCSCSSSASA